MPNRSNNCIIKDNDAGTKGTTYTDKGDHIHVTNYDNNNRESFDVPYGKNADDKSNALGNSHHTSKQ